MPRVNIAIDDIPFDAPFRVEVGDSSVVVIRTNDEIRAFPDRCPHAGWPLSEGEFKDGILQCIGHGWEFEIATGRCLTVPTCALSSVAAVCDQNRLTIEWE